MQSLGSIRVPNRLKTLRTHFGDDELGYAIIDSYFDDDLENAPGKSQLYKILRSVLDGC